MSGEAGSSTSQPASQSSDPPKNVAVLAKGCSVELKPCATKPCCCKKVHCPLCSKEVFEAATFHATSAHLVNEHISKGIEIGASLCLLCKLPCDSEPHFHCPTCPFTSRRSHVLRRHSDTCHASEDMWTALTSLQVNGITELLEELGLEPNKPVPKPVKVFKHPSIVLRLTDIPIPRCTTCCTQYHCPICPSVSLKSGSANRIAQHLVTCHWKRRVSINNIQILKCTMNSCLRNPTRFGQSHYHCPLCPKVTLAIKRAKEHFLCHRKGTVKKERVESCNAPQTSASSGVETEELAELIENPNATILMEENAAYIQVNTDLMGDQNEGEEDDKQHVDLSSVNLQLVEGDATNHTSAEFAVSDHQSEVPPNAIQPVLIRFADGNFVVSSQEEGTIDGQHLQVVLPHGTVTSDGCIVTQDVGEGYIMTQNIDTADEGVMVDGGGEGYIMTQEGSGEGYIMDQSLPGQVFVVNPTSGEITGHTVGSAIQFHALTENVTDENVTENPTDNVTENVPENPTENVMEMTENVTENISENVMEIITDNATNENVVETEDGTKNVTENVTENVNENVVENMTENVIANETENMTNDVTENVVENVTDDIHENIHENASELKTDNLENASEIVTETPTEAPENEPDLAPSKHIKMEAQEDEENNLEIDCTDEANNESADTTSNFESPSKNANTDEDTQGDVSSDQMDVQKTVKEESNGKKDFDVLENVSADLNRRLFDCVSGARHLMSVALNKNFGLHCQTTDEGGVRVEGAWWQVACAHMLLEEIRDKKPSSAKQLMQILNSDIQETDKSDPSNSSQIETSEISAVESSPKPQTQPTTQVRKKRGRGRPRKNVNVDFIPIPTQSSSKSSEIKTTRYKRAIVERPATRSKRRKVYDGTIDLDAESKEIEAGAETRKTHSETLGRKGRKGAVKTKAETEKERREQLQKSVVVIRPVKSWKKQAGQSEKVEDLIGKLVSRMHPSAKVSEVVEVNESETNPNQDKPSSEVCEDNSKVVEKTVSLKEMQEEMIVNSDSIPDQVDSDLNDSKEEEHTKDGEELKQDEKENILTIPITEKEVEAVDSKDANVTESWDIEIKYTEEEESAEKETENENERGTEEEEDMDVPGGKNTDMDDSSMSGSKDKQILGRVTTDVDCYEAKDPEFRTCTNCSTMFLSRPDLIYHLLETEDETCQKYKLKDFPIRLRNELTAMKRIISPKCIYCQAEFQTLNDAKVHVAIRACRPKKLHNPRQLRKSPATGLYQCPECPYEHRLPACVCDHMDAKHCAKTVPCPQCPRKFSTLKHLQRHVNFIHEDRRKVTCEICGKELMEKYLRKHIQDIHVTQRSSHSLRKLPEPVYCGEAGCGYSTHYLDVLKKHKKRLHGVKDKSCDICGANFAFLGDLNAHRKIHQEIPGRTEVSCPKCDKVMMKQNLAIHLKTVHEQKRMYTCHICNKSFTTKYVLNCHVETHKKPGERAYKFICDYCGAGFINKTIYLDHLNTHTGQRPYKCPTCGKSFRQTSVFHKHLELHSNVKYFCAPCNEMFPSKRAYSAHKSAVHMIQPLKILPEGTEAEQVIDCGSLSVEQAEAMLTSHSGIESKQILVQGSQHIILDDSGQATEIPHPDMLPTQSLVTLDDGTVVLVEGDLSQSAAEEGIVPEIVGGPETVLVGQELEGQVVQIKDDDTVPPGVEQILENVQAVQDTSESGFQCGHCLQYFTEIEEIRQHIVTFHSEHLEEMGGVGEVGVQDHATGDTTANLVQGDVEAVEQW